MAANKEKRDQRIAVYLTQTEADELEQAAGVAIRRPSECLRIAGMAWARQLLAGQRSE